MIATGGSAAPEVPLVESAYAWRRLVASLALSTIGGVGLWSVVVVLPAVQAEFGVARSSASLPYTATMLGLVLTLRRRPSGHALDHMGAAATAARGSLGVSPNAMTALLWVAGLACCVAMSMPQVHIVAYCGDLGYGVARGAEMLSLMLGFGVVSRIGFGLIADRIGGLATLLVGSVLQTLVLILYLGFSGLTSLYLISALFGLVQGGIVPAYAIIVREYFPPGEAGARVGIVIMATLVGMAFGGWISGMIFDLTGSYLAAFANGAAWNVLNAAIAAWLLMRASRTGSGRLAPA